MNVEKLFEGIKALSPAERFRVVAGLLEQRAHPQVALAIARRTTDELAAALMLRDSPEPEDS